MGIFIWSFKESDWLNIIDAFNNQSELVFKM